MGILRRVLIAIGGLLSLALAGLVAAVLVSRAAAAEVMEFTEQCLVYQLKLVLVEGANFWPAVIFAVAALVLAVLLFVAAFYKKQPPRKMSVSAPDGYQVEISQDAIDNVVRRAACSVKSVRGLSSKLHIKEDKLYVHLSLVVPAEESLPAVGAAVREEVAKQMEAMTGIVPQDIRVRVSKVVEKQEG